MLDTDYSFGLHNNHGRRGFIVSISKPSDRGVVQLAWGHTASTGEGSTHTREAALVSSWCLTPVLCCVNCAWSHKKPVYPAYGSDQVSSPSDLNILNAPILSILRRLQFYTPATNTRWFAHSHMDTARKGEPLASIRSCFGKPGSDETNKDDYNEYFWEINFKHFCS